MRILVSGASGLVGSALLPALAADGHVVTRLTRSRPPAGGESSWDPEHGLLDVSALDGVEAVVHLAGQNIASGRWTQKTKTLIRESRVKGTRLLAQSLAKLQSPPHTLICASAIGYYGSRGDEILDETSAPGDDFLASVCRDWEEAAQTAARSGIRVVILRFGVILSTRGGALAKMLTPFRIGAGGVVGDGRQYMSWIDIDDVVGVIQHALRDETLAGPVNTVSPRCVTNREFTKTLGAVLSRPTLFPMPAFVARALFGEMADALLLSSVRVAPARLTAAGFRFKHPELAESLKHLLGRS
ncbi:MAG TPA: TIGR01777 family oxidoreductase [Candidatus Polarisedimenticolia bacterium]|nr:TIGR01777 family oxidoreductase [Candidatus Polarisedimenticolia bacterium]